MADRSPTRSLALSHDARKAPKADSLEVSDSISSHRYGVLLAPYLFIQLIRVM